MDDNTQAAVVLHFRDGRTAREAAAPEIDIERQSVLASAGEISFDELKAVFFKRDVAWVQAPAAAHGSVVAVEFADGEIIRGLAHDYNPVATGFYLTPLEESKIDRIFVVSSAVVSIEVEKL